MKKKVLLIILALILAVQMTVCFCAESDDAWKNNTGTINLDTLTVSGEGIAVSDNIITITKGGDFEVGGTLEDGMIYVKSDEKVKLRLSGASITNSSGPAIFFDNAEKGFITITENTENYLTDGKEYTVDEADAALFSNDDLEIKGSGTLTVTGNYKHGIAGDDDVSIENGTIIINSYEHGIKVNDTLSVLGGNITIQSETGKGMKAGLEVIIDGGDINITSLKSEGIESKGILTINGGNINITAADDGINTGNDDTGEDTNTMPAGGKGNSGGGRGMGEAPGAAPSERELNDATSIRSRAPKQDNTNLDDVGFNGKMPQINPGEMPEGLKPSDEANASQGGFRGGLGGFGMINEETAAAHAITINGGTIYVNANGDGIDSNGNLTITGGNIVIEGPLNSGNGPLDCDGTMSITGGTVVLTSSAGMVQLPKSGEGQNILSVIFAERQSAGTEIVIKETQSGNEIISHTAGKEFQAFVFSSDKIVTGTEYTFYRNGTEYQTVTAVSGTSNIGSGANGGGFSGGGRGGPGGNRENIQNSQIRVTIDGKNVRFDTDPVIKNDTTLVGFRAILEELGAEVSWDEQTQTVTAKKDDVTIVMKIGSTSATVNGKEKNLLLAPEIINDSTMIPLRFVSEQLNMDVNWDDNTKLITITSK